MGRLFLEHLGGDKIYSCGQCRAYLTNDKELVSKQFTGSTGPAFLFDTVVNVEYSETQMRTMITGRHIVRDVSCKRCKAKLGWMYEYALSEQQRYKESKVILEQALIDYTDGFGEPIPEDNRTMDRMDRLERMERDQLTAIVYGSRRRR